jgi:hypothetical protein
MAASLDQCMKEHMDKCDKERRAQREREREGEEQEVDENLEMTGAAGPERCQRRRKTVDGSPVYVSIGHLLCETSAWKQGWRLILVKEIIFGPRNALSDRGCSQDGHILKRQTLTMTMHLAMERPYASGSE